MRGRLGRATMTAAIAVVLAAGCSTARPAVSQHKMASPAPPGAVPGRSGGSESLDAVAALGESDAWAVGTQTPLPSGTYPLTEHWDGARWQVVPCPSPVANGAWTRSSLAAVAIDAPGDAWVVGDWSPIEHNAPSYALIEHWNGAKWSIVPVPKPLGYSTTLASVAAISPTAAWAIGSGTNASGQRVTIFMGWNGTSWRYLPGPVGIFPGPGGLAATSAHDVWLVGEEGATKSAPQWHNLIEHWSGSQWMIVPEPYEFRSLTPNIGLSAVGGSSGGDVWAVGSYRPGRKAHTIPLIEHWDGTHWRVQPSPDLAGYRSANFLDAVSAAGRTSAWAVGHSNRGSTDRALGWHPLDDCAEPASAGCDRSDPKGSRRGRSQLRLGCGVHHREGLPVERAHREMEQQ